MSYRRNIMNLLVVFVIWSMLFAFAPIKARACTGMRLIAADGSVVYGRTLEFGKNLHSEVLMIPRGYERTGATPDGKPGLRWKSKYASLGANGIGLRYLFDGLNEKGLAVGMFYFPGTAGYMAYDASDADTTLASWQFGSWILENFATVDEVKAGVEKITLAAVVCKAWGAVIPAHHVVHDAAGNCIVIEAVEGHINVYDNPLGVLTNSPAFDWHITNLRNYINLSPVDTAPRRLGPLSLIATGQGAGMLGLPGDFTPPSRFVRSAEFSQSAYQAATGRAAVLRLFHLLNNFDIPKGVSRSNEHKAHTLPACDYTQWTSANDLTAKRYYFHTHANRRIRVAELMKMDLDANDIKTISMRGDEDIENITDAAAAMPIK